MLHNSHMYNLIRRCNLSPAGQDYQSVTNIRLGTFGNSIRRQCFNVNILNDTQSENPEYFMIQVQFCHGETFERVDIDPSTGTTTVMDDSELRTEGNL